MLHHFKRSCIIVLRKYPTFINLDSKLMLAICELCQKKQQPVLTIHAKDNILVSKIKI